MANVTLGSFCGLALTALVVGMATAPVVAQDLSATPINWVNGKNVTVSGNTITESCNGCGDAGAESQQTLAAGDGYFEFVVGTKDSFSVGIGGGAPSTNVANTEFALRFNGSGSAEVRENGGYVMDTPYKAGDRFRIAIEAGIVNYYKYDGSRLRPMYLGKAAAALQYPIKIEAVLFGAQASVSQAVARAARPAASGQNITWTNVTNARVNGNTLVGGSESQNSGAQSVETLTGDGYMEFTAVETDKMRAVGLDNQNGSNTFQDIDFAIVLREATAQRANAVAEVWENGTYRSDVPYSAGDRFRIAIENGVVKYYKYANGSLVPIPSSNSTVANYPLHVDAALYGTESSIADVTGRRLN